MQIKKVIEKINATIINIRCILFDYSTNLTVVNNGVENQNEWRSFRWYIDNFFIHKFEEFALSGKL